MSEHPYTSDDPFTVDPESDFTDELKKPKVAHPAGQPDEAVLNPLFPGGERRRLIPELSEPEDSLEWLATRVPFRPSGTAL